ncbi:MAG: MarR family transcriptional regulator [Anaerolineaceae bacterium]|nr:MarR family transcriptional regulator [Anaerolineaceae bacterium]
MLPPKLLPEVIHEWSKVFMQRSMRDFKRFMDTTSLSFSQINILMQLLHCGNSKVSEVGKQLGVSNAAASQAVDRLVGMGLIERTEDPQDRRTKRLVLTQKGQAVIRKGLEERSKWIEEVTKSLTLEQQKMIGTALTLLTEAAQKINN